jgi:hypothetical protein
MSMQMALGRGIHPKFSKVSIVQRDEQGEIHVTRRMRLEHDDRAATQAESKKLPTGLPGCDGGILWLAVDRRPASLLPGAKADIRQQGR